MYKAMEIGQIFSYPLYYGTGIVRDLYFMLGVMDRDKE